MKGFFRFKTKMQKNSESVIYFNVYVSKILQNAEYLMLKMVLSFGRLFFIFLK